jgi:citrate lyase subunit beta / citryl-CoA lyase
MPPMRRLRRTILFVPANNPKMMEKASKLGADMVILDCEDSVPIKEKLRAREYAPDALRRYDWGSKEVGIRINGLDTPLWLDDLKSATKGSPSFILIPKIEEPSEVKLVDQIIRYSVNSGEKRELPKIVVAIENARGLMNIEQILAASELTTAIEFGAEDYSLSLGILSIERSEDSSFYARSRVVAAARALSIDALDQAYVNLNDLEGLKRSAIEAKNLGFSGKSVIHPNQIEIVNQVFSPTAKDISWGRRVLEAWKVAESEGKGAFRFEDKMVDIVHVKMAEEILRIAKEAGLDN